MNTTQEKNWLEIVKTRFEHPAIVLWRAVELKHIASILNRYVLDEPVLDLGCAEGNIADILFPGRKIFGLDNCWELLSKNKNRVYQGLVLADACHMPYKNQTFSSIFSNCVIEHIPDLDTLLNEVARILKESGVFFFTVPSHRFADFLFFSALFENLGLKGLAGWYKLKRNKQLSHFHCYGHERWRSILEGKGLKLVEYRYYMPIEATSFWDYTAAVNFLFRAILPLRVFLPQVNKRFANRLNKYYNMDSQQGSGLLIVARKSGAN